MLLKNEKVSHDESMYSSFKVTLSAFDRYKVLNRIRWPHGIQCKLWHDPRPYDYDNDDENNNDNIGQPLDGDENARELTGVTSIAQA